MAVVFVQVFWQLFALLVNYVYSEKFLQSINKKYKIWVDNIKLNINISKMQTMKYK